VEDTDLSAAQELLGFFEHPAQKTFGNRLEFAEAQLAPALRESEVSKVKDLETLDLER
jgi:hypothetical protein